MLEVVVLAVVVQMEVALAPQEAQAELHQAEVAAVVSPILAQAVQEELEDKAKSGFGPTDEWINTKKPSRTIRSGRTEDRLPAVRYGWLWNMD